MTLLCKDCKHYAHLSDYSELNKDEIEHQCHAIISLVTGTPDIRDAEAMRRVTWYAAQQCGPECGPEGKLFEKNEDPNRGYMPNPWVKS